MKSKPKGKTNVPLGPSVSPGNISCPALASPASAWRKPHGEGRAACPPQLTLPSGEGDASQLWGQPEAGAGLAGDGGVLSLATRGRTQRPAEPCLGDLSQGLAVAMASFPLASGGSGSDAGGKKPWTDPKMSVPPVCARPWPLPCYNFPTKEALDFFPDKVLEALMKQKTLPPLLMILLGGRG